MNILFINFFCRIYGFEIPRVSVFGYCHYAVTFPYVYLFNFNSVTNMFFILYTYLSNNVYSQ